MLAGLSFDGTVQHERRCMMDGLLGTYVERRSGSTPQMSSICIHLSLASTWSFMLLHPHRPHYQYIPTIVATYEINWSLRPYSSSRLLSEERTIIFHHVKCVTTYVLHVKIGFLRFLAVLILFSSMEELQLSITAEILVRNHVSLQEVFYPSILSISNVGP